MTRYIASTGLAALTALLAAGCGKKEAEPMANAAVPGPATAAASAALPKVMLPPPEEAAKIFKERCVVCHGSTGAGDGVGAAAFNPKPRAFGDSEWQKSVTDDHIALVIEKGGAAAGKSPLMPPNPDLSGKSEVIAALVKTIRGFDKAPGAGAPAPSGSAPAPAGSAPKPAASH